MDEAALQANDARSRTCSLIRERHDALAADVEAQIASLHTPLKPKARQSFAELLLRLFVAGVEAGSLDVQSAAMRDLARYSPALTTRHLLDALHHAERIILDEVALDDRLGATSEPWAFVAHAIRRATLEILAAHAEQIAGRDAPLSARDPLTTLISEPVLELALGQEIERALRHQHALALLLFDIDDLSQINREHGWGVGDRVLERIGIQARRYFRTHDWVARHGDDGIAVLLPETTLDQAALLASRFREMVPHRLVLQDHKTDVTRVVTVSAAAVGSDLVRANLEAPQVLMEAEAAVLRARMSGHDRVERVALLPTAHTIFGAAGLLELSARDVSTLIREGTLRATRRGRHLHIDRELIEAYRKAIR